MHGYIVLTKERLQEEVQYFLSQPAFSFDIESYGDHRGDPLRNPVTWLSMATNGRCIVIPLGHPNGDTIISKPVRKLNRVTKKYEVAPAVFSEPPVQLRPSEAFAILEPLFFHPGIVKVAHNATYDLGTLAKYYKGRFPTQPFADTIVMQHLLDENLPSKKLKDLIARYYGFRYDFSNVGKQIELHTFGVVAKYAYLDAKYTWLLYKRFSPRIEAQELTSIFNLEMDILEVLLYMYREGAPVDIDRLKSLNVELGRQLEILEGNIYVAAGRRFNINSTPQRTEILYGPKDKGGQGLTPKRLTKGGLKKQKSGLPLTIRDYSTDAEALELYPTNKVVQALTEYAEVNKIHGTYIQAYLGNPDAGKPPIVYNGRIHADFVQYGTVTGRFSCREPNLQNIPNPSTELGKQVRGLFIAPSGYKLVVADYGQIELVVLASYCGTGRLFEGLSNGVDAHTATAAAVFGVPPEKVDKKQRAVAKALNFAIVYGAGMLKVASMSKTSTREATGFLEKHERQFPEIYRFKQAVIKNARSKRPPHIRTILGRKRRVATINAGQPGVRQRGERQIFNSLIQGGAADIIKLAMVRLHRTLLADMRLILSVHDELVVLVPEDRAEEGARIVREAMEGSGISDLLRVPPKADIKIVDRWSEAK